MNTHKKLEEGYSTQRPPMFNENFFSYWKNRMEIFIKAENYQVWRVIEVGDFEVTTTNDKNEVIPKPMSEYDKDDFDKMEVNARAVKLLHCGLGPHEHNKVMGCKNAKQIWDLLQVTHKGTNEVNRSKIDLLMSKYERFEMNPKESIQEMFTRFTNKNNELVSLGRTIPIDEQVRKILRSLPQDERWRAKVTALQETKDFTKFNIEQLVGSLMTHELHLGASNTEISKNRGLVLRVEEQEDSEPDEEEVSMMVRKFRRFYKNLKTGNQKDKNPSKRISNSKPDSGCFKCGSSEHLIRECPLWETDQGKAKGKEQTTERYKPTFGKPNYRKAMISAWGSDSESEDDEEPQNEEMANLCLMAKIKEKKDVPSNEVCSKILCVLSKEKLIELLLETLDDFKKLSIVKEQSDRALKISKDHITYLNSTRSDVQSRFFDLLDQNTVLKESLKRTKHENITLNVELAQYKLFNVSLDSASSIETHMRIFNVDFEKLNNDLVTVKEQKEKLEKELALANARKKEVPKITPKYILDAQVRKREGLGFSR
ncbi:uncharacterized protein LOC110724344 [Chenopodium quinoa]|uniref:uncharacterized protein LOC110724344 n=1 Tax=Chenopodium quinoa TaxID=63459 RepID=UPI000B78028B|nr:uncharacterized protein LOC110724344 [Chenopodium quinoa]